MAAIISRNIAIWSPTVSSRRGQAMQSATQSFEAVHRDAVVRVYDEAGNVIETDEHAR